MRSRPEVSIVIWPQSPRAGQAVNYELTLASRSETPIDAVNVRLTGEERWQAGRSTATHDHFRVEQTFGPVQLAAGQRLVLSGRFDLPAQLPNAFATRQNRLEYRLVARVDIPWWPDRVVAWTIPVRRAPEKWKPTPGLFSNLPHGPRGTELAIEVALDETDFVPGDTIRGAAAVSNAAHHRITRLEAKLVSTFEFDQTFSPKETLSALPAEVLCDGAPEEGASYPFSLRLPNAAPTSVRSKFGELVWRVQVRAAVRLGLDKVVEPQIRVHEADDGAEQGRAEPRRAPPVGAERRTLIWNEVAAHCGLAVNAEEESMTGAFGPVRLRVELELRDEKLWSVANLEWPNTHLHADLTERRWLEVIFGETVPLDDTRFDWRFTCRARDPVQLKALLSPSVRERLFDFERVTVDDDGAVLATADGGYVLTALEQFVAAAVETAKRFSASLGAIPPPLGLENTVAAWSAHAEKLGGTFVSGDCSIRGATYRGTPVELVTRFGQGSGPEATVARVLLPAGAQTETLTAEAQRVLTSVSAECEGVRVVKDAVEATLPCPLPNPERAELLWRTLQRLAQALLSPTAQPG